MFRNFLKFVLSIGVFAAVLYFGYSALGGEWAFLYNRYFPCRRAISYSIAEFDTRFGVSEADFLKYIEEAVRPWEEAINRDLFAPADGDSSGNLKINLIYDHRQEATDKIKELDVALGDTRAIYEAERIKYNQLKREYMEDQAKYDARVVAFKTRQDAYEREVNYWNKRGGAPKKEYDELKAEGEALEREFNSIKNIEAQLNDQIDEINALVSSINTMAKDLNLNVAELNEIGEARGEEFTEGEYRQEGGEREINVYEWSAREKLVRLLTHELGHALGLSHVEDPEAIMYYLNQNKNGKLTKADIEELKTACKIK